MADDLRIYQEGNNTRVDIGVPKNYGGRVEEFPAAESPSGTAEEAKLRRDFIQLMSRNTNLGLRQGYLIILERLLNCAGGVEGTVDEFGERLGYF